MVRSLLAALLFAPLVAADDSALKVKVGDAFPDVKVKATNIDQIKKDAKEVSIADLKGKTVVIFFYPRAMTGGCTTESCGFRDLVGEFPKDVVLVGASNDPVEKNQQFNDKEKLPYPLLCDTNSELIKALGILAAGKDKAKRVTFVVDKDGKIAKIYETVNVKEHPKQVLADVKALK